MKWRTQISSRKAVMFASWGWLFLSVLIFFFFFFKSLLNKPVKQWTSSRMPHLLFVWLTSPLHLTFSPVPHPPYSFCFQVSTEFQFEQTDLKIRSYDPHLRECVAFALGAWVNLPSVVVSIPFLFLQISFFLTIEQTSIVCVPHLHYLFITRWPSRLNPFSSNCE